MTRVGHLKQANKSLTDSTKDLQVIVDLLRTGTDSEAAATLARLRVGDTMAAIALETISDGSSRQSLNREYMKQESAEPSTEPPNDISGHIRSQRFFDRQGWGGVGAQNTGSQLTEMKEGLGLQHALQTSRSLTHLSGSRSMDAPPPYSAHHTPPTMIKYSETNPQELVKLRNFGNLNFSSGILSNNYPHEIQHQQLTNIFTPQWAMMTVDTVVHADHPMAQFSGAVEAMYTQGKELLKAGVPMIEIAGPHPRVAALLNNAEFERAPVLSQWAARMVYSCKEKSRDLVSYSSIYIFWWILRWMIEPTLEHYIAIPDWIRPTPTCIFMPHTRAIDFFIWPGFRDYACRVQELFERPEWLLDMSLNISVFWPHDLDDALSPSEVDGELELSPKAMLAASSLESWSVKPSFRKYLIDADRYIKIKLD